VQTTGNLAYGKGGRMGRPRKKVDVGLIIELYTRKGLSVRKVARVVGVSHDTVARRLEEAGIKLRKWMLPEERSG